CDLAEIEADLGIARQGTYFSLVQGPLAKMDPIARSAYQYMCHSMGIRNPESGKQRGTFVGLAIIIRILQKKKFGTLGHITTVLIGQYALGNGQSVCPYLGFNRSLAIKVGKHQNFVLSLGFSTVQI